MMRPRTPPMKASGTATGNGTFAEEEREKEKLSVRGLKKKGMGVRAWMMIDPSGRAQLVEAGKHAIMRRACLPARDLRILDPLLSYPSTILGRERAIVVNLEHIKAIITAQEVLLLNSRDPAVIPIVLDLQRRLPLHFNALGQQVPGDGGGGLSDHDGEGIHKPAGAGQSSNQQGPSSGGAELQHSGVGAPVDADAPTITPLESRANSFRGAVGAIGGPSVLPFEFRALEVCLEAAITCLDAEATMLEREAYPALDELTSKLSTLNLERVRQIKSRLVAISGRVQKVRDEIEQLLDDDGDMAEMYLTDKLLGVQMEGSVSPTSPDENSSMPSPTHFESSKRDLQAEAIHLNKMLRSRQLDASQVSEAADDERSSLRPTAEQAQSGPYKEISGGMEDLVEVKRVGNHSSSSSSSSGSREKLDVEELEMLLEAYFVQIEGTVNKLSALREYVDDTEDYINIMLDDKQNHLLQMGVLLTTATLVVSGFIVVTGIFGMNIHISLFNDDGYRTSAFLWVVCGSFIGCVVVYVAAIAWCKYKRLIE